jgi:hypothetical protein
MIKQEQPKKITQMYLLITFAIMGLTWGLIYISYCSISFNRLYKYWIANENL